jgi:heme-degrading monooxygenase HmoA
MIVRTWKGATRAADTDAYLHFLDRTGHHDYAATPGNLGWLTLRCTVGDRTDWTVMSFWDSLDSIRAFAGADVERARFYPEDEAFLVDRELWVTHHELAATSLPLGAVRAAAAG